MDFTTIDLLRINAVALTFSGVVILALTLLYRFKCSELEAQKEWNLMDIKQNKLYFDTFCEISERLNVKMYSLKISTLPKILDEYILWLRNENSEQEKLQVDLEETIKIQAWEIESKDNSTRKFAEKLAELVSLCREKTNFKVPEKIEALTGIEIVAYLFWKTINQSNTNYKNWDNIQHKNATLLWKVLEKRANSDFEEEYNNIMQKSNEMHKSKDSKVKAEAWDYFRKEVLGLINTFDMYPKAVFSHYFKNNTK